jgi:hypothetical protein
MNSTLAQARLVWSALLLSGVPLGVERWTSWADANILASDIAPPEWLSSLAVAQTREAALAATSAGLGLEAAGNESLDPQTLVIGFVVGRHVAGELNTKEMWSKLAEVADIAEFLDSGKWRPYTDPSANGLAPSPLHYLIPVATFANEQAALLFQPSGAPNPSVKGTARKRAAPAAGRSATPHPASHPAAWGRRGSPSPRRQPPPRHAAGCWPRLHR